MPRIKLTKPVEYRGVTHPVGTVFDADIDRRDVAHVIAGHGETIDIPHSSYERDVIKTISPLPWRYIRRDAFDRDVIYDANARCIVDALWYIEADANGEFIVRACNNFQPLLDACKRQIDVLGDLLGCGFDLGASRDELLTDLAKLDELVEKIG